MSMQTVEWDRSTLMALFLGGINYILEKSYRYSQQRRQFSRPISDYLAATGII